MTHAHLRQPGRPLAGRTFEQEHISRSQALRARRPRKLLLEACEFELDAVHSSVFIF